MEYSRNCSICNKEMLYKSYGSYWICNKIQPVPRCKKCARNNRKDDDSKLKFYTIYKITNLINNKYYIGMHMTYDLNDNYFGSGSALNGSIRKHGKENFKKEILFIFDTKQEMLNKESEIVTREFCRQSFNYNLHPGGFGGGMPGRIQSEKEKQKRRDLSKQSKKIMCIETNEVFSSIGQAARKVKNYEGPIDNITGCCSFIRDAAKGKCKKAYGLTWQFID